jgi:hypothetical protein
MKIAESFILLKIKILILCVFIIPVWAMEYTIVGNSKTKTFIIENKIAECQNAKQDLTQCLLNTKLFSEVFVQVKSQSLTEVTVKDRFSIIPIPLIKKDSYSSSYGLMLVESNLFGRGDKAIIAVRTGTNGSSFFSATDLSSVGVGTFISHMIEDRELKNIIAFEQKRSVVAFEVGPSLFRIGAGFFIYDFKSHNGVEYQDTSYLNLNFHSQINKTNFRWYFNEGNAFEINLTNMFKSDQSIGQTVMASYNFEKNIYSHHALQFRAASFLSNKLLGYEYLSVDGNRGFRGIEDGSIWLKNSLSLSLDYQIPIKTFKSFTWTFSPFYDYSTFQASFVNTAHSYSSLGVGSYLFIKTVAIPGMGFILGRSESFEVDTFFKFFVGMRM